MKPQITVKDVAKKFRMYRSRGDRLKELIHPHRRAFHQEFWALDDVSFELQKGRGLGIIGRNGSGKSTLLQIICGNMRPTRGSVAVDGRIWALLELGAGFHAEFTGRENAFLNGALMGFTREQMEERFDAIASFADIGAFIDQPVKSYSSGMRVRLAFACAVNANPDILIIDEALSVGDVFFRQKCHARIESMVEGGVTLLLVTHDMRSLRKYCDEAIVLHAGKPVFQGDVQRAIRTYHFHSRGNVPVPATSAAAAAHPTEPEGRSTNPIADWPDDAAFVDVAAPPIGTGQAEFLRLAVCDSDGEATRLLEAGDRAAFFLEFRALADLGAPMGVVTIMTQDNVMLHGKSTYQYDMPPPAVTVPRGALIRIRQEVELNVAPGPYIIGVGLNTTSPAAYRELDSLSAAQIRDAVVQVCHVEQATDLTVVMSSRGMAIPHFGLCDLPGGGEIDVIPTGTEPGGAEAGPS